MPHQPCFPLQFHRSTCRRCSGGRWAPRSGTGSRPCARPPRCSAVGAEGGCAPTERPCRAWSNDIQYCRVEPVNLLLKALSPNDITDALGKGEGEEVAGFEWKRLPNYYRAHLGGILALLLCSVFRSAIHESACAALSAYLSTKNRFHTFTYHSMFCTTQRPSRSRSALRSKF